MESTLEEVDGNFNEAALSSEIDAKPVPSRDFGSAKQGMPGDGSTGSFSAEPFAGRGERGNALRSESEDVPLEPDSGLTEKENLRDAPASPGGYEKPGPDRDFGSAKQEMPGDGSTGSFSAEPFAGSGDKRDALRSVDEDAVPDSGLTEKEGLRDAAASPGGYEKPDSRSDFGSAEQGMPGDGSSGSFSAEPFSDRGEEENALQGVSEDAAPEPDSGFIREEDLGEVASSGGYEKPDSRSDFGSAEQGMPGDGSTGSFSAEPFTGEIAAATPLTQDEKIRRLLPYRPSDSLEDIHFAFDKYDLDDRSRAILKKNAAYLQAYPIYKIEVEGYCDERGSNSYNLSLGERRAQSTKSYLITLGIDTSRIRTISYGEERPFCFESNEICWHQNRRVHFLVAE